MKCYHCPDCDRRYAYELDECTFCRVPLKREEPSSATVLAVTRVDVPSLGHEDVPYWCLLVRDENGCQAIEKRDVAVNVGETVVFAELAAAELVVVGVVGTGVMGRGLVEMLLSRGHTTVWVSRSDASLQKAHARVYDRLARTMDDDELAEVSARLVMSTSMDVLATCDVVIEAVIEELAPKQEALREVEAAMRPDAILATNTSGLPLDELSTVLARPELFGALHFFNPPGRMRLVETSLCAQTSPETSEFLDEFALSLGKVPVRVAQRPAFVVNRVLMPLINEAIRSLEEDAAPAASIDEAVRLGLNHPMGPLALADLIGLDVVLSIMENLVERTGDLSYDPRPMLRRLVAEGKLGRKTGEGFHVY
jgi:3-hydroxybutyryl-CoA dehydrogenase